MIAPLDTDAQLQEWGNRLFYARPKRSRPSDEVPRPRFDVRARVRAEIAPRARQVVVRISGGGRGMKAIAAHMRYIGRQGKAEVGGKGQSLELENEQGDRMRGAERIRQEAEDWAASGSPIPEESHRREAFNIILSMPGGTDPRAVHDAARVFARETFAGHKYLMALHEDTDAPHVHLVVRAERSDGVRLNPRKADLAQWRERFAARLQDRGIHATATRAVVRGARQASQPTWRLKAGDRLRNPRAAERSGDAFEASMVEARQSWEGIARVLATSGQAGDRELAADVLRYVFRTFIGHERQPGQDLNANKIVRGRGFDR